MGVCTFVEAENRYNVGMGQIAARRAPARFTAVLGSCVGLAIYHPRLHIGGFAHVVLPHSRECRTLPGKFANLAVPALLRELQHLGAQRAGLVAKIAGGAQMFGKPGPMQIGDSNVEAVSNLLLKGNIRLLARETGGKKGRRVTFDCATGELKVEVVGMPAKIL